ncbi:MAG TPA: hypothetical protein VFG63_04430 [Nocardioidaceae bacterium]|nr:hypothetical protein [Nocardioidaceae bacterium]
MRATDKLSLATAGLLTCLALAAFSPAAQADEGFYSRNGADLATSGTPNGNRFAPASTSTSASDGFDISDAAIGALAGLVAAGAGVVAVGSAQRRRDHLAHPA